ncbi:hypothetical protein [Crossiella equi]|uniref:hypothetical protein n=1 Tax=Crossiella equi TaxID=130796 RepID=UPI000A36ADEC|nr:hypothetical protein [Crossiella equi]
MIESYLGELDSRLQGPKAAKADLLAEAEHSLRDVAEAYADAGIADADARAVREFGPIPMIAREYQAELAAAHGAYAIRSLLLAIPLIHVIHQTSRQLWEGASWQGGALPPDWFLMLTNAVDYVWVLIAVFALLALVVGKRVAQRWVSSRMIGRSAGAFMTIMLGGYLVLQLPIVIGGLAMDGMLLHPSAALTTAAAALVLAYLVHLTRRCFVLSAA